MKYGLNISEDSPPDNRIIRLILGSIILGSFIIRAFLASFLELGNDEVYYWTYALFPDLSHFDHPPMVGFTIQAFSWNLSFDSELFIRLGSVVLGSLNTILIFLIAKKVKNALAGLFAAMLYNTSVYCFVIAGIFILPDTPQLFFWLVSLYLIVIILPGKFISPKKALIMFYLSIPIGLAMLSKYTSVFLWLGTGMYILFYNRHWLRKSELYLSVLLTLLIFSPVIFWNIENKFISFAFQSERVSFFDSGLRMDYFFTELFGQIFYSNPVNFIIIIIALIALLNHQLTIDKEYKRILLLTSLPLVLLFLFFSLFRQTLPHWTSPGYISLIIIAAVYLAETAVKPKKTMLFPWPVKVSGGLLLIVLIVGFLQIKTGLFTTPSSDDPQNLGSEDISLDMYGWKQFAEKFSQISDQDFYTKNMNADAPVIAGKWFPAAHLDYYFAQPFNLNLLAIGNLQNIHKYAWINRQRPEIRLNSDAYFITNSRNFQDPSYLLNYFLEIEKPVIIRIFKSKKHVENFFVYRLRNCFAQPPDVLEEYGIMSNDVELPEENSSEAKPDN